MRKNNLRIVKVLFLLLSISIFLWIILSVAHTGVDFVKVFIERNLIFASDDKKRFIIFGEIHPFFKFVERNTGTNSSIEFLILNKNIDNRFYYLSYYYLYPRNIYFAKKNNQKLNATNSHPNKYLIIFGFSNDKFPRVDDNNIRLVGAYKGKIYRGVIYKVTKWTY